MPAAIPVVVGFVTSPAVVTAMIVGAVGGLASGGGLKGALKGALFGAVTAGIASAIAPAASAASGAGGAGGGAAGGAAGAGASAATSVATNVAGQIMNGVGSSDSAPDSYGWLSGNTSGVDDLAVSLTGSPSAGDGVGLQDVTQAPTNSNPNPDINIRLPGDGGQGQQNAPTQQEQPTIQQVRQPTAERGGAGSGAGIIESIMGGVSKVSQWSRENPDAAKILGGGLKGVMDARIADSAIRRRRQYEVEDRNRLENNARWVYTGAK